MPPLWIRRSFEFNLPVELHPLVVERLRGVAARLEDKVGSLPENLLTRRDGDRWSIQEHIGHLLDLDELHVGRLDDYLAGTPVLRAADMTNRKTWQAGHNTRPIAELLRAFRDERGRLVARLDAWPEERWGLAALHPRLEQPMRVVDMALFVAEHDDHHLTWMTELMGKLQGPHA
jgi:uncharacterized damage-inducible protein DinB